MFCYYTYSVGHSGIFGCLGFGCCRLVLHGLWWTLFRRLYRCVSDDDICQNIGMFFLTASKRKTHISYLLPL